MKKSQYLKILFSFLMILCIPIIAFADSEFFVPEYTKKYLQWDALSEEEKKEFIEPEIYEDVDEEGQIQTFSTEENMVGVNLPARFARSDYGEVRKQDGNLCWACSAATMFETNYRLTNYRIKRFSDIHMDYMTSKTYNSQGFNRNYNDGGNVNIALAYATNGMGIVENANMTSTNFKNAKPVAKVSDYEVLSTFDEAKNYLYHNGVLSAYTYMGQRYFSGNIWNNQNLAYYCSDTNQNANHAVTIIGWDDNYTNAAFAGQKGAFIALNSYGTEFGNNGLYYIFYSDVFVKNAVFYAVTKTEEMNYDYLYQYDEYGQTATIGWSLLQSGTYASNVFTRKTKQPEILNEIGIYFPTLQNLTVYINTNGDDKDIHHATYVFSTGSKAKGYHTIKLPEPITLNHNQFTIGVKYNGYMGAELASDAGCSWWKTVSSNYGESYISMNGRDWRDLKTASELGGRAANACIKAFTKKIEPDYSSELINYVFDYRYYAEHNLDLYRAFGYNQTALKNHWENYGKAEGRAASCVFDAKQYLENNGDLRTAFGNDYTAAYRHFMSYGYKEYRKSSLEYDGNFYKNHNGDLQDMNAMQLIRHYALYGKNEARQASDNYDIVNSLFDASIYAKANPDLTAAFGNNEIRLKDHWLRYGIAEGRTASLAFDSKYYLEANGDLKNAYGNNYMQAYQHFIKWGFVEKRQASPVFSVQYYLENNGDLKNAYGTNYLKVLNHFKLYGKTEKRPTSSQFNVEAYQNKNGDLKYAYGNRFELYYMHYMQYGRAENRVCR